MRDCCPFYDYMLIKFYGKAHCGLYCTEISENHYQAFCQNKNYFKCSYLKEFCRRIFNDGNDIL